MEGFASRTGDQLALLRQRVPVGPSAVDAERRKAVGMSDRVSITAQEGVHLPLRTRAVAEPEELSVELREPSDVGRVDGRVQQPRVGRVAVRPPIVPRPPPRPPTEADGRGGWYSERATA